VSTRISLTITTELAKAAVTQACEHVVGKTTTELEAATKMRIVQVGAVDTGNMLGTVNSESVGLDGRVNVPAPYSLFVHEGHRLFAWGHDMHRWVPGRPFLRGPADEMRPDFYAALERALP
jgi:hypothetical protein